MTSAEQNSFISSQLMKLFTLIYGMLSFLMHSHFSLFDVTLKESDWFQKRN